MSKVIKFPTNDKTFRSSLDKTNLSFFVDVDNIISSNMNAVKNFKEFNIISLQDKPLVKKNIFNNIYESNSSKYIKDRNILIFELLINGLSPKDIINLTKSNVQLLDIDDELKNKINSFYYMYIKNHENIFLKNDKKNKISIDIIISIQKKYIKLT